MSIQKMNLRHRQIARRLLLGESQKEVAKTFGISECHISRVVHSPAFGQYVDDLERDVDHEALEASEHLRKHANEAVEALIAILQSPESSNREKHKAALDVLKLGFYDRPQTHPQSYSQGLTFEQRLRDTFGDFEGDGDEGINNMTDNAEYNKEQD